ATAGWMEALADATTISTPASLERGLMSVQPDLHLADIFTQQDSVAFRRARSILEIPYTLFPSANRREREGLSVGTEPVPSGANNDTVPTIRTRHLVKIAHRQVNLIGARIALSAMALTMSDFDGTLELKIPRLRRYARAL